jgi:hypothetical protein
MSSSQRARAAVIATGILLATPAAAQDPPLQNKPTPPPPSTQPAPPPPQARPMSQQPEAMTNRPTPQAVKRGGQWTKTKRRGNTPAMGAPIVNAPTFHRLDDGSTRVSVEVSSRVDITEAHAQGRLIYRIKGAYVANRVNALPLLTGFFATPVDRAQLNPDGPDVDLVIDLRGATTPAFRVVETPRGIVMQIDFPRVAGADKSFAEAQEGGSREHAKRRTQTQTLSGGDNKVNRDED